MKAKAISILISVALLGVIVLQNTEVVTLKVLFWQFSMSRIIFLPLVLAVGFLLGLSTGLVLKK